MKRRLFNNKNLLRNNAQIFVSGICLMLFVSLFAVLGSFASDVSEASDPSAAPGHVDSTPTDNSGGSISSVPISDSTTHSDREGVDNSSAGFYPVFPSPEIDDAPPKDTTDPSGSGTEPPEQTEAPYDYSAPVPLSEEADDSYFADAVFIGDSRQEGFALYSGLKNVKAYTGVGIAVNSIFTKEIIEYGNSKISIMDALSRTEFSKVYIMLGLNEMGWGDKTNIIDYYEKIIDRIREINPDAMIYVQTVIPVSEKKSSSNDTYTNENIAELNELLIEMAEEKLVFYLDMVEALADETGVLPADAASDGVHLTPGYCKQWLAYLKTHTIGETQ